MTIHAFSRATLPSTPWKNGGGLTQEIVCRPTGAGLADFDWRASIARIDADGPFSAFPGIDRVITLLEGGGVHLQSTDGAVDHRLDQPLQPWAFSGDVALHGRLLGGASADFNVMVRRSRLRAQVDTLRANVRIAPCARGLLYAVRGTWHATPDAPRRDSPADPAHTLDPDHGLWWDGVSIAWQLQPATPDAALLAVRILTSEEQ